MPHIIINPDPAVRIWENADSSGMVESSPHSRRASMHVSEGILRFALTANLLQNSKPFRTLPYHCYNFIAGFGIKLYPGRTERTKIQLVDAIVKATISIAGRYQK
ncbi:MAG: hypothetical protein GXO97_07435 [Nitrospirae bacterium]|nr:hypothetical protein [Nitrospirota bacterium]